MKLIRIDRKQRLYCYRAGSGYSCVGFDYADRTIDAIAKWLSRPELRATNPRRFTRDRKGPKARRGTRAHWEAYVRALKTGSAYHDRTGERCDGELVPQLVGLEGKRIEVLDAYGDRRRFNVGKSTGWFPCHLEISRRGSSGGPGVTGTPFKSVRVI